MKFLIILISALHVNLYTPVHDVPIAMFHITESDASILIDITFDVEDFATSLDINSDDMNLEYVQKYLDKNTSFLFNDQVEILKVSEVKIVRDHIRIKGSFGKIGQSIKTLKVENTCLNNVSRHSNIIQIDLNNKSRDFRMHKGRKVIDLAY